jgi:hypothetical protein
LDSNKFDAMEDMFHIQVKGKLFGKDWLKCFATDILDTNYERTDVVEVMKRLTHLMHINKQNCFKCYRKTTRCSMEPLEFIHIKWYTLTLIQMPSLYILGLTSYLESILRLSNQNSNILLELVF